MYGQILTMVLLTLRKLVPSMKPHSYRFQLRFRYNRDVRRMRKQWHMYCTVNSCFWESPDGTPLAVKQIGNRSYRKYNSSVLLLIYLNDTNKYTIVHNKQRGSFEENNVIRVSG